MLKLVKRGLSLLDAPKNKKKIAAAFDKVGDAWLEPSSTKPHAALWGVPSKKRAELAERLPEYRCAFAFGKSSWKSQKEYLRRCAPDVFFVADATSLPEHVKNFLETRKIPLAALPDHALDARPSAEELAAAFDLVGDAWRDPSADEKPLAVLWGTPSKKRAELAERLPEYRCAFAFGKRPWRLQEKYLQRHKPDVFFVADATSLSVGAKESLEALKISLAELPAHAYAAQDLAAAFDLVGDAWRDPSADEKPLAVLWGVPHQNRKDLAELFHAYRCVFAFGKSSWMSQEKHLQRHRPDVSFAANAKSLPDTVKKGLEALGVPLVELPLHNPAALQTSEETSVLLRLGDNWTDETQPSAPVAVFFDVPSVWQKDLARHGREYSCAFARLTSPELFALLGTPSASCFVWEDPENLDGERQKSPSLDRLSAFCRNNGISVSPLPKNLLWKLTLVPLTPSDDEEKPVGVILGDVPKHADEFAPHLSEYRLYALAPHATAAMAAPLMERSHTVITTPTARADDGAPLLSASGRALRLYTPASCLLWNRGQKRRSPFYALSETEQDYFGLDALSATEQLSDPALPTDEKAREDGARLLAIIRQLWRARRQRSRKARTFEELSAGTPGVLAVWHNEEAQSDATRFALAAAAAKEAGNKPVYCLQLENGKAVVPGKEVKRKFPPNCRFLSRISELDGVLDVAEAVYVIGSPLGFEALLYGKRVVVFGAPFFAGWGLTEDVRKIERPHALALPHATAAVFMRGRPFHAPYSTEPVNAEHALALQYLFNRPDFSYFPEYLHGGAANENDESFGADGEERFIDVRFKLHADDADTEEWLKNNLQGSAMGDLYCDLLQNRAPTDVLKRILASRSIGFSLELYGLINVYCRINILYDALKDVSMVYKDWFAARGEAMAAADATRFYRLWSQALAYNRFRDFGPPPPFFAAHNLPERDYAALCKSYLRILSATLAYDLLEEFLQNFAPQNPREYYDAARILAEAPRMRERDAARRDRVIRKLFKQYANSIAATPFAPHESAISDLLLSRLTRDMPLLEESLGRLERYVAEAKPSKRPRRFALLAVVLDWLLQEKKHQLAYKLYVLIAPTLHEEALAARETAIVVKRTAKPNWPRAINAIRKNAATTPAARQEGVRYLAGLSRFKEAESLLTTVRAPGDSVERLYALSRQYHTLRFYETTSELCALAPRLNTPKGYVFILSAGVYQSAIYPIVTNELASRGYASVVLSSGIFTAPPTACPEINQLRSTLEPSQYGDGEIRLDWTVDWENKEVSALGINFYYGVYEYLTIMLRTTKIDWHSPLTQSWMHKILHMADANLRLCVATHQTLRSVNAKGAVLLNTPYAVPQSVWLNYMDHHKDPCFRGVFFRSGPPTTLGHDVANRSATLAAMDLYEHPECRLPFLARPEKFAAWYAKNKNSPDLQRTIAKTTACVAACEKPSGPVYDRILKAQKAGKKIVCCYGRLLFDRALRVEGGPGHEDMQDWILHTIETARSCPDMLLLVKPHPHEDAPSLAADALITMKDVLPPDLPENVVYLESQEFTTAQLNGVIDLATLWLGTAAMELTMLGLPVILASHAGQQEIPINCVRPQSREEYAAFLRSLDYPRPTDEDKKKAAGLFHYLQTDEVVQPYECAFTSADNDFNGIPYYDFDRIDDYFKHGDPHIAEIADRILDGLDKTPRPRSGWKEIS